jgi:hypothetical protein
MLLMANYQKKPPSSKLEGGKKNCYEKELLMGLVTGQNYTIYSVHKMYTC